MSCKKTKCDIHRTSIGGQAVIEGVMMRGPKHIAVAVRKSDGEIIIDKKTVNSIVTKFKLNKIPVIRGIVNFIDSMITGVKALTYSAELVDLEDDEEYKPSKFEQWMDDKFGDKIKDIAIYTAVAVSLFFSIGLFYLLPNFLVGWCKSFISDNNIILHLVEGCVRISIFLVYLTLVSQMKDIQRVFQYHGAEHKTIHCYESGAELTPENAKQFTRLHPRCGTNFLLIVMVISILIFSFLSWDINRWAMMGLKLLLLPLVAGVSYEIIKLLGKYDNKLTAIVAAPGMWLQYITTREPDESQLEVAIASLEAVLTDSKEDDKW
ncbi:MAG: DUF1385 domain-containing protein [Eubacteriales bacterium]|nr:DUF1385 domain-containing protein [Eubacteriales bacterium]